MRKLVLFAAILAILGAYGCNEDNVYNPDVNTDGRVIGTIQGVVTDGADATLLAGVEVSTTVRGEHVTTVTDATGHYSFTNLDPGAYLLTFVETAKGAEDPHTTMYGHAEIPTLEALAGIMDVPTDADFPYEIEANMEMFPLIGTAEGYVYVQTDAQTMVPAAGCQVVADFLDPGVNTSHTWGTVQIADNEWTATCDENGHYSFTGLPAGAYGEARTMSYSYDGVNYQPLTGWDLDLRGGDYVVDNFIFDEVSGFFITNQNWADNIFFPPTGSFTATFSKAVDPSTFTAVLMNSYTGDMLPATVTWTDAMTVTIDPENDLDPDTRYSLEINAWSTDGETYASNWNYIYTVGTIEPAVASTNFEDSMTFPIDGNLEIGFNMPMDPASIVVRFDYDKVGDIVFDASWNEDYTMLTIDPDVDLDYNEYYQVLVQGKSASGMDFYSGWLRFQTLQLQDVQINDTNFMANFDNTADLWFVFSEPMDPATMTIGMEMWPSGTPVALEDPVWSDGNTKVTLNPVLDLDKGVYYTVNMEGMAAGGADFSYEQRYKTSIGDDAFVVTTNVVDHEFPVDGTIEVRFSKPMATETVEVAFSGVNDLYGAITWTDDMNMVFDPDPDLLPDTQYTMDITGEAQDGGTLAHDANNPIVFYTIGGIVATWDNIRQIDGSYDEFPVDSNIEIRFSLPVNLDAEGTDIVVERYFDAISDWVPVLIKSPTLEEDGVLLVVDPEETLQKDTDYRIAYTVGSFLLGDTTSDVIAFHTQVVPPEPVSPVAAFTLDPAWDGDYDTNNVTFTWLRDPNATYYYVYARPADAAKDDYLRLAEVPQAATDTISTTVTLPVYYDTRSDDTVQTPFEGNPVMFRIAAYNSLGEGTVSDDIAVYDVTGPEGVFTGQDVSADDSATADGEDLVVTVDFRASEYLDPNVIPNVTITENDGSANDWGDPNYTPDANDVSFTFEDMDGYTVIHVQVLVADGMNGAGDYVAIDGFKDTSGNDVPVDFDITPYQLTDSTIPTGTFADPGVSADNSTGSDAVDFTLTFTATELLDETVTPVVAIVDGGISDVLPSPTGFTYSVVDGVSVVELDMSIPAFFNVAEDTVAIFGLTDMAGNSMTVANAVPYVMVDTTAPGGEWTAQSASSQNDTASDVEIEVTFTASEYLDTTVTPTFEITDGGYTGVAVAGDLVGYVNDAVNERTDVTFTVTIPADYNAMDDVLSVNGLTDIYGNVQDVAIEGVLLDTTAPADPTGLAATASTDSPASVALIWDANHEADLGGYNIYRTDGVDTTLVTFVAEPDTEYVDTDAALVLGTTYGYVVMAVDVADPVNESGPSNQVSATPDDTTAPAIPTGLIATGGEGSPAYVDLVWDNNDPQEPDLAGFNVYRSTTNNFGTASQINGSLVTGLTYHDTDGALVLGTTYYYWVTSVDDTGNESGPSNGSNTAPVDTNPAAPTNFTGTSTIVGQADLTWDENTEPDMDHYVVYYSTTSPATGGTAVTVAFPAGGGTSISGLTSGTTYYFDIVAVDGTPNTSALGGEVSFSIQ